MKTVKKIIKSNEEKFGAADPADQYITNVLIELRPQKDQKQVSNLYFAFFY